jgi:formate--tetrahydrofolate ligase
MAATRAAMALGDYVVTEAGFGSDLGAEKFFDIKCRAAGLNPDCAVLVATVRALKYNGRGIRAGVPTAKEEFSFLENGIINLKTHIENLKKFDLPVVVAINRFRDDTLQELEYIKNYCAELGVKAVFAEVFAKGGEGGVELAQAVIEACKNEKSNFKPLYGLELSIKDKILKIATEIYRADGVDYTKSAEKAIDDIEQLGFGSLPICVAKTQYSLSDDPAKLGKPESFRITVRDLRLSAGAGFIVALTGDIMTLPGLPRAPAANSIDIDKDGVITGLF